MPRLQKERPHQRGDFGFNVFEDPPSSDSGAAGEDDDDDEDDNEPSATFKFDNN